MTKTINGVSDLTKNENKTQKIKKIKTDKQQIGYVQKPEVSELQGVVCTRPPESDSGVRKEELLPMSVCVHKGGKRGFPWASARGRYMWDKYETSEINVYACRFSWREPRCS